MTNEWRASEALPPHDGPPITDRQITATCPDCDERHVLFDVPTRFQSSRTTYTCPGCGAILVRVVEVAPGQLGLDVRGGMEVDPHV